MVAKPVKDDGGFLDVSIYKKDIYNHKVFIFSPSPSFWCALFFPAVAFHQQI